MRRRGKITYRRIGICPIALGVIRRCGLTNGRLKVRKSQFTTMDSTANIKTVWIVFAGTSSANGSATTSRVIRDSRMFGLFVVCSPHIAVRALAHFSSEEVLFWHSRVYSSESYHHRGKLFHHEIARAKSDFTTKILRRINWREGQERIIQKERPQEETARTTTKAARHFSRLST